MRTALLIVAVIEALALAPSASAAFRCFDTPGQGHGCACIGASECKDMLKSGYCTSDPRCDNGELGATICSCKAKRTSQTAH